MHRFTMGAVLVLAAAAAFAHGHEGPVAGDCSSNKFHFDDRASFTRQEVIDAGMLASLKTEVKNAPLTVTGGNSGGFRIVVCKAAAAEADLDAIRVTVANGELKAEGPDGGRWMALFHIHAPDGGKLELGAENGPVAIREFDGSLTVRAKNGPLSLKNVGGEIDAVSANGPVSLSGGSGSMRVRSENGPLSIRLDGNGWAGGGLDAESSNGPVTLKLPRGYGAGVVVESAGGPLSCKSELCGPSAQSDEGPWHHQPRTIELGSGAAVVRVKSGRGPVSIKETD